MYVYKRVYTRMRLCTSGHISVCVCVCVCVCAGACMCMGGYYVCVVMCVYLYVWHVLVCL